MTAITLFPFADYYLFYAFFILFILVVLVLDLGVFHKKAHAVSFKEASIWTTVWVSLGALFSIFFYYYSLIRFQSEPETLSRLGVSAEQLSWKLSLEYLTGFVVEKSLAIDNIFVFAVVFSYFKTPKTYQHRVLFWGILGALLFRGIFIALGSVLMQYEWVVYFFGGLLIITGIKMLFAGDEEKDLSKSKLIIWMQKFFRIHSQIEGDRFFIRKKGLLYVTPLFLALMFIEFTDIIFAIDSVPAIFSLTNEPLIVFTSNIFAILGLRSMFFMLSGALEKFWLIKYGLAGVLVFVGLKMTGLNHLFGGKFPIEWSLLIIAILIGGAILASLVFKPTLGEKRV